MAKGVKDGLPSRQNLTRSRWKGQEGRNNSSLQKKQGRDLVDPVQGGKFQGVDECRRKKVFESWRLEWKEEKDLSGWSADQTRLADFYCVK